MKVANGVEMLELDMNVIGRTMTIHPTLLYDDNHAVLIDVGMPRELQVLRSAIERTGVAFDRIDAIILTHQDIDHVGGIQDVLEALGKPVDVFAHAEDKPYIEGEKPPIKMSRERVSQMLHRVPEDIRKHFEAIFLNPPTAKVTKVVSDGDVLPFFGGVEVIFTPGHTPGHISLYHHPTKTLITGDAIVSEGGKLLGPNPEATLDMPSALESMKKFTKFEIARAICYHGGLCDDHVNEQLLELTN